MEHPAWTIQPSEGPLVAAAIHDGHDVRGELSPRLALSDQERLREEDPYTGKWAEMATTSIVVHRSRFEVDLNRPREKAVYLRPEDAWGLHVWRNPLPDAILDRSYRLYDAFHEEIEALIRRLVKRHGRVVVFDLHSYNHRRGGPEARPDRPSDNPTINLGTSNMDLTRWGGVVDRFERSMQAVALRGEPLDIRRNVKFRGGNFPQWIHETFPESACALAIEVKKVFMDEWTSVLDTEAHGAIGRGLAAAGKDIVALLSEGGI